MPASEVSRPALLRRAAAWAATAASLAVLLLAAARLWQRRRASKAAASRGALGAATPLFGRLQGPDADSGASSPPSPPPQAGAPGRRVLLRLAFLNYAQAVLFSALAAAAWVLADDLLSPFSWVGHENVAYDFVFRNLSQPISVDNCSSLLEGGPDASTAEFYTGVRSLGDLGIDGLLYLLLLPGVVFLASSAADRAASGLRQHDGLPGKRWHGELTNAEASADGEPRPAAGRLSAGAAANVMLAVFAVVAVEPLLGVVSRCGTEMVNLYLYMFHGLVAGGCVLVLLARAVRRAAPSACRPLACCCTSRAAQAGVALGTYALVAFLAVASMVYVPAAVGFSWPVAADFPTLRLLKALNLSAAAVQIVQAAVVAAARRSGALA